MLFGAMFYCCSQNSGQKWRRLQRQIEARFAVRSFVEQGACSPPAAPRVLPCWLSSIALLAMHLLILYRTCTTISIHACHRTYKYLKEASSLVLGFGHIDLGDFFPYYRSSLPNRY